MVFYAAFKHISVISRGRFLDDLPVLPVHLSSHQSFSQSVSRNANNYIPTTLCAKEAAIITIITIITIVTIIISITSITIITIITITTIVSTRWYDPVGDRTRRGYVKASVLYL